MVTSLWCEVHSTKHSKRGKKDAQKQLTLKLFIDGDGHNLNVFYRAKDQSKTALQTSFRMNSVANLVTFSLDLETCLRLRFDQAVRFSSFH